MPSIASAVDAAVRRTVTVPGRSLAVVEQLAGQQSGFEIAASQIGGVLVRATRHQLRIPPRQRKKHGDHRDGCAGRHDRVPRPTRRERERSGGCRSNGRERDDCTSQA